MGAGVVTDIFISLGSVALLALYLTGFLSKWASKVTYNGIILAIFILYCVSYVAVKLMEFFQ